jgi:preprotein translocase subunit SecE
MAISITNNPVVNYVRESKQELQKVAWPSRKVVVRDTLTVIGVSLAVGVFFGIVDFGLLEGLNALLARIQLL